MPIPSQLQKGLRLPAIAAPLFLVSQPPLVSAACKAGVIGSFPSLNARPLSQLDEWMAGLTEDLAAYDAANPDAPSAHWAVNLIVHKTNPRLAEDLELVKKYKPKLVITSVGHPGDIVKEVHAYGGLVFHDVIHMHHARKAMEFGADGIIAVCAGAGGHAGLLNPFTFIPQLRKEFDGTIILAGTISDGRSIRAAQTLGADFAYLGTRFIATQEAAAQDGYKQMIADDGSSDVVYTDKVSGIKGNFLSNSLANAGFNPETGVPNHDPAIENSITSELQQNKRGGGTKEAWKTIWSAGQGIGMIDDAAPTVKDMTDNLVAEYQAAVDQPVL